MKILIIEDEEIAADRLSKMLLKIEPGIEIVGKVDSVAGSVQWLGKHDAPDLIFMDIHLADGSSLDIFRMTEVKSPVIFITAFDEYALQAFKVNSIDYLLKPIKEFELEASIKKFKTLRNITPPNFTELLESLKPAGHNFQKRIMVRYGQNIKVFDIDKIAYFYTEERVNFLCSFDGVRLPVDYKLDELEELLDNTKFFRINRQVIVNISAIEQMFTYSKARVKVVLRPPLKSETIVSSERSAQFKDWLLGK